MVTSTKDALTLLKEEREKAQASNSPFFYIKVGEKALVRLLRDYDGLIAIKSHRKFEGGRYVQSVCAEPYEQPCQGCLDGKLDWQMKAQYLFYLPVFVHRKIGTDGVAREVNQQMLLEMWKKDGILTGIEAIFEAGGNVDGELTKCDLIISRTGERNSYTVVARRGQPVALPPGTVSPDDETICSDVELAHPTRINGMLSAPPTATAVVDDPFSSPVDEFGI